MQTVITLLLSNEQYFVKVFVGKQFSVLEDTTGYENITTCEMITKERAMQISKDFNVVMP